MSEDAGTEGVAHAGEVDLGNLKINFDRFCVYVDEELIDLGFKEFEALTVLYEQKDRILPYRTLAAALWQATDERAVRNLAVLIHRLRRKLARSYPFVIRTVRGRGYGLMPTPKQRRARPSKRDSLPPSMGMRPATA